MHVSGLVLNDCHRYLHRRLQYYAWGRCSKNRGTEIFHALMQDLLGGPASISRVALFRKVATGPSVRHYKGSIQYKSSVHDKSNTHGKTCPKTRPARGTRFLKKSGPGLAPRSGWPGSLVRLALGMSKGPEKITPLAAEDPKQL